MLSFILLECVTARFFLISVSRICVDRYEEGSCFVSGDGCGVGGGSGEGDEQFPAILPALYPGLKATDPRPYASLDAIWRAFSN